MVGWSIKEAVTRQLVATELPALRSHQPYQPACTGATHQYVHVPALRDMRCACGGVDRTASCAQTTIAKPVY